MSPPKDLLRRTRPVRPNSIQQLIMKNKHVIRPGVIAAGILALTILGMHACRNREDWPCDEGESKCLRVVEAVSGIPVENAQVYLVSKPVNSVPQAGYNLTTDQYGMVKWSCDWAITDVCVEAGDAYWDACGSGYTVQDNFLSDGYYELNPKAWVKIHLVDTFPLNPELRVVAFSDFNDTYEAEGAVPGGYYAHLGVIGGVNTVLRVKRFTNGDDYVSSELMEVLVHSQDILNLIYRY